jgi:hypothetical protein
MVCLSSRGANEMEGVVEIEVVDDIAGVVIDEVVIIVVTSLDEMELTANVVFDNNDHFINNDTCNIIHHFYLNYALHFIGSSGRQAYHGCSSWKCNYFQNILSSQSERR